MRPLVCLAALAAGAALAAATAATDPSRLSLMPLPRSVLGPAAAGFVLLGDSGPDSNEIAAGHTNGRATAGQLARAGRITGYTLDYAHPGSTGPGALPAVVGIQTIAELYRSGPSAAGGLRFWRGVTAAMDGITQNGLTSTLVPFPARVGDSAYGFSLTYRHAGKVVVYVGDVVLRIGDVIGAVFVTATAERGLRARTLRVARQLADRIRHAQHAKGTPAAVRGPD